MSQHPSYHEHEEYKIRLQKLKELSSYGVNPYPHQFHPTLSLEKLNEAYERNPLGDSQTAADGKSDLVIVAGRLVLFRAMGKNAFGQIQGGLGSLQVMFNRELTQVLGLENWESTPLKFLEKKVDLGDFIGIKGHLFRTQKGQLTLFAKEVTLLCKALLSLPEKHSGIVDKEIRYRKRWLDLISNQDVKKLFTTRSHVTQMIRQYLWDLQFIEVETPILQNIYGGAEARPFTSYINAIHQESFLRISLEIPLKKLIVGGMERIFEIGKVFRNEGIDKIHNPEFTMLEAYAAYWDYNDMMQFAEKLIEKIALDLFGSTELFFKDPVTEKEVQFNVNAPWERLTMVDSIKKYVDFDVEKATPESMKKYLLEKTAIDPKGLKDVPYGALVAMLFDELVVEKLIDPVHIIDHPIETTPLCKPHREKAQREKGFVERFESFILGRELCNAYTELNDPVIQRELLVAQGKKKDMGDEEAHPLDEEFIEAICQGMPPTGGIGIGIDRLIMLLTNTHSIKDVLFFPMMKPE